MATERGRIYLKERAPDRLAYPTKWAQQEIYEEFMNRRASDREMRGVGGGEGVGEWWEYINTIFVYKISTNKNF